MVDSSNQIVFINITPSFENSIAKTIFNNEHSEVFILYLWYDLYIRPNNSKVAKLFFNEDNKDIHSFCPLIIELEAFFLENNIYIDKNSLIINNINEINIIIYNKNDFYIHIKNGTKIANALSLKKVIDPDLVPIENFIANNNKDPNSDANNQLLNNKNKSFLSRKRNNTSNYIESNKKSNKSKKLIKEKNNLQNNILINKIKIKRESIKDFENDIENPIYDIYMKSINNFKNNSFYSQVDLLIKNFTNLADIYWDTTSKALKKLKCLLLYINKGKKGNAKKTFKNFTGSKLYRRKFIIFVFNTKL